MSDTIPRLNAALEGRYRIERELGEGGMARVYLAEDVKHGRMVALKVLKPELAAVVGAERFLAEIETTAKLQHPHVLPLHDSGEADGLLFYVMPFVEGESLRDRLDREHQLPVDVAVRIATSLAEALDYAHRHGVIHRDIKPANVMLLDGMPLISDFGIALAIGAGGGGRLTETGLSLGTPHYMSPEQVTGDRRVGPSSDIWALGCVLYEMLVGEPPYTGGTPQALLGRIIADGAPSASSGRRAVPGHVDGAIRRALEKLPADRFAGADDFAKALGDPGFRHGAGAESARDVSIRRTAARAAAALVVVVTMAVAVVLLNRPPGLPAMALSITLPGDAFLAIRATLNLDVSPTGRVVAYNAIGDGVEGRAFVRPLDRFEASVIPGSQGGALFFSHDGQWVAYEGDAELRKAPVGGGPSQSICAANCIGITEGTWTAEDTIIFTRDWRGLFQVSASGGDPVPLTTLDVSAGENNHVWPAALPGGGILYGVTFLSRDPEIRILQNGKSRTVLPEASQARYTNGRLLYSSGSSLFAVAFDPIEGTTSGQTDEIVDDLRLFVGGPQFAVGDDGTLIYVPESTSSRGWDLVRVSRDGQPAVISRGRQLVQPRLSPEDSTVLLFAERQSLWTLDVASKIERRLTIGGTAYSPIWAPGDRVLFGTVASGANIFIKSADERDDAKQFLTSEQIQWPTTVTPDGLTLVFSQRSPTTGGDIWVVPFVEGAEPSILLGDQFTTWPGGVSPDGRWLVYTSNEHGGSEVYVTDFPDVGNRWRVSIAGGGEPVWSPRGGELFYREDDRMMMVTYRTGERGQFDYEPARVLFERRYRHFASGLANYAVAADGQSFFMLEGGEAREIRVLRGWEEQAAPASR